MSNPSSKTQMAQELVNSLNSNDVKKGLSVAQKLNQSFPDYAHGWYLGSRALGNVNRQHAIIAIDRALQLDQGNAQYLVHKAKCILEVGGTLEARKIISSLPANTKLTAPICFETGMLYCALNQYLEAVDVFKRAIDLEKNRPHYHYNLAVAYRFLGLLPEAEEQLNKVLQLNPADYEAHHLRSGLRRQTKDSNHIAALESALDKHGLEPVAQVHLYFSLAKEREDIGDVDGSFRSLKQGADIRRKNMRFDVRTDLEIIETIRRHYSEDIFGGQAPESDRNDPIFILGMPRSGTTLVERILASHSAVYSLGEPDNFSQEMIRQIKDRGIKPRSRLDLIEKTLELDFSALGESYINSVQSLRDDSPHFIDKLPFNYLNVGLIHLAMPKARIINVQRHPMATCYAVYKQLFKDAYPFSYDLTELAQYYVAYHQLMAHWNAVLPGVIHTVAYEDVVANTEAEARKLLQFCGLNWEPQCLQFYDNAQASTTASAAQIRQPVYKGSVAKWRDYREHLQPLEKILSEAGINIS
ncbi:MAG: sulfotransferase [Halioglobus sp.]